MFYDRESMIEMFEIAMSKRHIEGSRYIPVLITCAVELHVNNMSIDLASADIFLRWQDLVYREMYEKDASHLVNQGNIFALIHENHFAHFVRRVMEHATILLPGAAGFYPTVREITPGDAKLILSI